MPALDGPQKIGISDTHSRRPDATDNRRRAELLLLPECLHSTILDLGSPGDAWLAFKLLNMYCYDGRNPLTMSRNMRMAKIWHAASPRFAPALGL